MDVKKAVYEAGGLQMAILFTLLALSSPVYALNADPYGALSPAGEKAPSRNTQTEKPSTSSNNTGSRDSLSFLMGDSSISDTTKDEGTENQISEIVSNKCSQEGDAEYFDQVCKRQYSDGVSSDITTHGEVHGSELKIQTQTVDYDARGAQIGKKTIREKVKFIYEGKSGERLKESHYVDVVTRPSEGKSTREFYIYKFDVKSQKMVSSTWTKYEQINMTRYASLVYNVVLNYDATGNPENGKAERWRDGKLISRIFDWNKYFSKPSEFDPEVWKQWQKKTESVPLTRLGKDGSSLAGASVSSF